MASEDGSAYAAASRSSPQNRAASATDSITWHPQPGRPARHPSISLAHGRRLPNANRVLVVDDDDAIRLLIVRLLRRAGFDTTEAIDGQDAIERLAGDGFDAVVLDVMMPRVDGFGVIRHLVDRGSRMVAKTVVVTAFSTVTTRLRLRGACPVLSKPFEAADLISAVATCAAA